MKKLFMGKFSRKLRVKEFTIGVLRFTDQPHYLDMSNHASEEIPAMTTRFLIVCTILLATFAAAQAEDTSTIGADADDSPITREMANRIEQALRSETKCDFADNKLQDVLDYLEKMHRIPFWLDKQALQDEGVAVDQQVTLEKSEITLQAALSLMLQPLGLTSVNADGVLKVTTMAKADEMHTTRVYPVADLIKASSEDENYRSLMIVLQQNTSGKWIDIDQEGGSMSPFPNAQALVVRQTQKIHREIEGILTGLRRVKRLQHLSSVPVNHDEPDALNPSDPTPPRVRSRRLGSSSAPSWQRPRVHGNE